MINNWLYKSAFGDMEQSADQTPDYKNKTIFFIPDNKIEWLNKKIEGLNKVANKLGLPPVGYKVLEKNIVQTVQDQSEVSSGMSSYVRTATKIEIFGEAPVIKGWKFIARILHDEGGNVIKSVPGEELPHQYRKITPGCDHCGYKRKRNDTFVLKNAQTNEYKQVGSSCLADFLGHKSPGLYASFAESMADLAEDLDAIEGNWEGGMGGGYERSVNIMDYLKVVYAVMKKYGWLSRSSVRENMGSSKTPTADMALNLIFSKNEENKKLLKDLLNSLTADDESVLNDALIWARSLKEGSENQTEQLSDYYWNLSVACSQERVKSRTEGIVASLPVAYDKAVLKFIKPDVNSVAGNKGQTIVAKGKIIEERMFGNNVVYDILTADNKVVRCTFPAETQLEGKDVIVEGTVIGYSRKFTYVVTILGKVKFLNADQYPARQQELQQELQSKQQSPKPDYQPGTKVTTNLTIMRMRQVETDFGTTTLVSMVDDFGMTVQWWTSNPPKDLQEGEKLNITATVKSVGDYKGTPQVTITRPKINSGALDEGIEDPRLSVAAVKQMKKQLKIMEAEFNQLCYGYSQADHPEVQKSGYNAFFTISTGSAGYGVAQGDMEKAIGSVFPPNFYRAASIHINGQQIREMFLQDNLEPIIDQFINACSQNIRYNKEIQWEEQNYLKGNKYDIEDVEREKKSFEESIKNWPNVLEEVKKLSNGTSTYSIERLLDYKIPYEINNQLQKRDSMFWSHQLSAIPKDQWTTFINQTVQPLFEEHAKKIEQKMQEAWAKTRRRHQEVRSRIQQEEAELQDVIQNKPQYIEKFRQMIASTPFRAFLQAKPKREELSKSYNEIQEKLSNSKDAVKRYGPLEETKKKQANWLTKLRIGV